MKMNVSPKTRIACTHEGALVRASSIETELRRAVMSCMLWEDQFYESGEDIAQRIARLIPMCRPDFVAACAAHARWDMKLRHVPLMIVAAMTKLNTHKHLVSKLLPDVIGRADEITEFLAIYYKLGAKTESAQVKKGLAKAFQKFSEYDLAKYNRDGAWKLRDAMFLSHAKPADVPAGSAKYTRLERKADPNGYNLTPGEELYRKLANNQLETPDTWEVNLSAGADKRGTFERLMDEGKLGALALLRNLRNMSQAGVPVQRMREALSTMKAERVLPFRFLSAARHAQALEPDLEAAMYRCLQGMERLQGPTALLIDHSGSMDSPVSGKSDLTRSEAAIALGILARELCDNARVFPFHTETWEVPARRGFALRDAILGYRMGGTNIYQAVKYVHQHMPEAERIILITDEQSTTTPSPPGCKGYLINVASYRNGVGYGDWVTINGWSEAILSYIQEYERG